MKHLSMSQPLQMYPLILRINQWCRCHHYPRWRRGLNELSHWLDGKEVKLPLFWVHLSSPKCSSRFPKGKTSSEAASNAAFFPPCSMWP